MIKNIEEGKKFILYYALLAITYFVARLIDSYIMYWIVCFLAILLIASMLNYLNNFLKKKNCSKIIRALLVILIPGLIIMFFYILI